MLEKDFDKKLHQCIVCNSEKIRSYFVDFRDINIDKCGNCGFQFMNPQYSKDYLNKYYSQYSQDDDYNYWKEATFYGHRFYLSLVEKYTQPGKLLDIGCGNGHLLEAAKSRDWLVSGYDVDKESTKRVADRLNVKVYSGDFFTADFTGNYDLICMHQVLEHLKDPNAYLSKTHTLLKDNGHLFIAVPNIKSLANRFKRLMERIGIRRKNIGKYYDTNHHLLYFQPATLIKMLEKHSFSISYRRNCHSVKPNQSNLTRFIMRNITDHIFAKSAFLIIARKK